jgi:beta-galactosidase
VEGPLYNEYHFLNLDFGELHWQLEADGIPQQEGTVSNMSILPRRSKDFLLPVAPFRREQGKQYALRLGVRLKEDGAWAEKG